MALRIFDIQTGDYRDASQLDIDELCVIRAAYSRIQQRFTEDRALLIEETKVLRSRAGAPNEWSIVRSGE